MMADVNNEEESGGEASCREGDQQGPSTQAWYDDPIYKRYWEHYQSMHRWFKHHDEVVSKLSKQRGGRIGSQEIPKPPYLPWPSFNNSPGCHHVTHCCCCCCCCCRHSCGCCSMPHCTQGTGASRGNSRSNHFRSPNGSTTCRRSISSDSVYSSHSFVRPANEGGGGDATNMELNASNNRKKSRSGSKKSGKKRRRRNRRNQSVCDSSSAGIEGREVPPPGDDEDDFDLLEGNSEMEGSMTEELADFFAQSARHRKERDLLKKKAAEEKKKNPDKDVYIEMAECSAGKNKATVLPPTERPGIRRIAEMRELYGAGAAMIQGMETAMQLSYDRNLDRRQPKLWPALPINIKFED